MLPLKLKLLNLRHCYIHLPDTLIINNKIKHGAIISIKSIQTDHELLVTWNGRRTNNNECAELDLRFAQANNFDEELVIVSVVDNIEVSECTNCRAELENSADYVILSQHSDINLLDSCTLVSKDVFVPISVCENVNLLVKIVSFEPATHKCALLTKWTEMTFLHNSFKALDSKQKQFCDDKIDESNIISEPIAYVSSVLGIDYNAPFFFGSLLICGERGSGKTHFVKDVLNKYKMYYNQYLNCKLLRGKRPESIKKKLLEMLDESKEKQPSLLVLDDIDSIMMHDSKHENEHGNDALYQARLVDVFIYMIKHLERIDNVPSVALIATCRSIDVLDKQIAQPRGRRYFCEIIKLDPPSIDHKVQILKNLFIAHKDIKSNVDNAQLTEIAKQCRSFMPIDLKCLFERALINACSRCGLNFDSEPTAIECDDFLAALLDYTPVNLRTVSLQQKSNRTFDCVGGMKSIKDELIKLVVTPIKYAKLYKRCPIKIQTSALLYGPPGCGKTLIAEALTNHEGLNSICVRGPELLSKYIGASEASVRDLFKRAHLARPCVIFFDEFESLVATRGSDSTGVTDRIVNQFLTILDGVEASCMDGVYIVAATSRPDMIDPAMLRPGRIDKLIYCPLPSEDDRHEILRLLGKGITFGADVNLVHWATKLTGFTGADMQALLFTAQLKALHQLIESKPRSQPGSNKSNPAQQSQPLHADYDDIAVSNVHLTESYDEMKPDIGARLPGLLARYPADLSRSKQLVATRATLA